MTKTLQQFDYDESALVLKALAHPTRLRIVNLIRVQKPCVRGIEEALGLAQPNVSQHLSLLRNVGILEAEREGNQVCYRIKNPIVLELLDVLWDQQTNST
jgi:DNA-binding transcriptional ArsR family regulator